MISHKSRNAYLPNSYFFDGNYFLQGDEGAKGEDGAKGGTGEQGAPGVDMTSTGVVFIVWGQTGCPQTPGTELLHQGRAASAPHSNSGSGANYLCLPDESDFSDLANPNTVRAKIVGVKYRTASEPLQSVDNTAMPCSVCYTTQAVQLMIPGSAVCPSGSWRREYGGYLMSAGDTPSETLQPNQNDAHFRTEYICVSSTAISVPGSSGSDNEAEIFHVHLDCEAGTSLVCGSGGYSTAQQLTCAVCTLHK